MTRSPRTKNLISIDEERKLIRKAQRGSREAVAKLVAVNMPYIRSYARGIAKRIIHRPDITIDVEDMISAGVAEFLAKIPRYDLKRPGGARIFYYARLDMKRAMTRCACDSLEAVRLPRDSRIHKAHRDLEAGMSYEELIVRHPEVSPDAVAALHRSTISLDHMTKEEELAHEDDEAPERLLERIWPRMDALDREVVTNLRLGIAPRDRARRLEIPVSHLSTVEAQVQERIRTLIRRIEDDRIVVPERDGFVTRVWYRLSNMERRVLAAMRLLRGYSLYRRARHLGVDPSRVRTLERAVSTRVRELIL